MNYIRKFINCFLVCVRYLPLGVEFTGKVNRRALCSQYFSNYDISRDTNLEIEKSPAEGIIPTRFVASAKAVQHRVVKMNYCIRELSALYRPRMRARVISADRNRIYRDFEADRIQIDMKSRKTLPLIASLNAYIC